jgi:hypothetical protein
MKKFLLSVAFAGFGCITQSDAQVILTENFNGPTAPALPSSWSQGHGALVTPGWRTGAFSSLSGWGTATGTTLPSHTSQVIFVDDWLDTAAGVSNLRDTLFSPTFAIASGMTEVSADYDVYFFNAVTTGSAPKYEYCYVLGSNTGAAPWTILDTVIGDAWNENWVTAHTSLVPLGTGSNMKIAFVYTDGAGRLPGVALDDFKVENITVNAAALPALGYNSRLNGIATNSTPLLFQVDNKGKTITSLEAYYQVNGGTPVVETFSSLSIAPYASSVLTFTTLMSGAVAGSNTVKIVITKVNGVANPEADSLETSTFTLASSSVQRNGLIEEFSSSTCPPCKSFNAIYDPLCTSYGVNAPATHVNVLKYQMNWPSPGTDRSYNPDGDTRKSYYGVSGIPDHFVNGQPGTANSSSTMTTELDNSKVLNAFFDMAITYSVDTVKKKFHVITKVTPHFTKTGNYHVQIAVADQKYENSTNTTGQLEYLHIVRKMLPNGSGRSVTSWADGVAQTFYDTGIAYTSGDWTAGVASYPTQGSYKFWSNPLFGSEVVAFIQEDANKSVMQSLVTVSTAALTVSTLSKVDGIDVFPNPATDQAFVKFNLQQSGNVEVKLMDYAGRLVKTVTNGSMDAGAQNIAIPTANVVPGNYFVVITTDGGSNVARLTVAK